MFSKKFIMSTLIASTIISGCVQKSKTEMKEPVVLNRAKINLLSSSESAEKLARMGEILLGQEGFTVAYEIFKEALDKDPGNAKANFYKAFLNPIMKFKGFTKRVYKLSSAREKQKLINFEQDLKNKNMPEVFNFITKMSRDKSQFENYSDAQDFLRKEVLQALSESVENINQISSSSFQVLFNQQKFDHSAGYKNTYTSSSCYQDSNYNYTCNDYSYTYEKSYDGIIKLDIDRKDLKIIKGYFKTLANYLRLGTAYSINNVQDLGDRLKEMDDENGSKKLTAFQVVYEIQKNKDIFVLNDSNLLADLKINLQETLNDAQDFIDLNGEFCKSHLRENNLIKSICINEGTATDIKKAINLLSGPDYVVIGQDKQKNDVRVMVDISAMLENPINDLKEYLPTDFDGNGKATTYPDKTFKGLFPNGDIIEKLKEVNYSTSKNSIFINDSVESIGDYVD